MVDTQVSKLKKTIFTPTFCLLILLAPFFLFFFEIELWWIAIILFQFAIILLGFLVIEWRFVSLVTLGLLLLFNTSWFLATDSLPSSCSKQINTLTGQVKNDAYLKPSTIELIKVTTWCKSRSTVKPAARINLPAGFYKKPVRFKTGDRLEFKNLKLKADGVFLLELKAPTDARVFNLTFQDKVLERSSLLLYIQAKARYYLDGFALGVAKALLTADRTDIESQWYDKFRKLGVMHIFAISGMHIGIIYLWLSFVLRRILSIPTVLVERGMGVLMSDLISLFLIIMFLRMIGMPISAKRAVIMLSWWMLIRHVFSWQPLWFVLLGVANGILVYNPLAIGQVSFQLSFLSVFGILLILPFLPVTSLDDAFWRRFIKQALATFFISCWLLIFTFPVVHLLTGFHSPLTPLSNLIHILFVSLVFLPLLILVLGVNLLGYFFGLYISEFYLYSLVNFLATVWQKLLIWNNHVNDHLLFQFSVDWSFGYLILYWGVLMVFPLFFIKPGSHSKEKRN